MKDKSDTMRDRIHTTSYILFCLGRVRPKASAKEEEKEIDSKVCCEGAHPLCGTLSRRGLNPIMLAYDPGQPSGWPH